MRTGLVLGMSAAAFLSACTITPRPAEKTSQRVSADYVPTDQATIEPFAAPAQCFAPERQLGQPVAFHRGSILDQPVLLERRSVQVPAMPAAGRLFYCAAFNYAVDESGRVTDIITLYNSHTGAGGIDFAEMAERQLRDWRYQPGLVDKAPATYTGLSTVFYFGFEG